MYAGRGSVRTTHKLHLRVNGRSAAFTCAPNVADGDVVTLAGYDKGGGFKALALRNESTGVPYRGPTAVVYLVGVLLLLIGLPFSFIIIGIPLCRLRRLASLRRLQKPAGEQPSRGDTARRSSSGPRRALMVV